MKRINPDLENIQVKQQSFECSITTDVALFGFSDGVLKVLLTKRTVGFRKDYWLLPGGVMEDYETVEACASKVLNYLTGIKNVHMEQVKSYSALDRHDVKRVVTVSFYALVQPQDHPIEQKIDVTEVKWFALDNLPENIGFDHRQILEDAHKMVKLNLRQNMIFGELLPETFTLNELQTLYEAILEEELDKRNFRKKISQLELLENTGIVKKGVKGGPWLYRKSGTTI
ncbi:NUDIX domain-containing protein [Croceitalea sp. MTPC9]|uniref:NUDIX hydrolase n=1 Tax=unclassified Croceitalea TaxID=2632280 RepID=UPI002B395FD1|nr:NUDIX domain-containing protein [Croceitalea sp. MTPC6]GMN16163.1 NUDIX domain-containing protein [Croceitalea sp. MTPC9]